MAKVKGRTNLKLLRVKQGLTQEEFAALIGCGRLAYMNIENGKSAGRNIFWASIKRVFPTANIEELKQLDEN